MDKELLKLIVDFYKNLDRQGPGSNDNTRKALSFVDWMDWDSKILDIGCGTGAQTFVLASSLAGHITAVDLYPDFLDVMKMRMRNLRLENRITTMQASMDDLPFPDGTFDLVWAEGSIYNMGFEKGLRDWKRLLKPGAYIGVTEVSYITAERPVVISEYWAREYPGIDKVSNKISQIENLGYTTIAHFVIPENCWLKNYFTPIEHQMQSFRQEYPAGKAKDDFIEMLREEMEMFRKYKGYFGYVFYIARNS